MNIVCRPGKRHNIPHPKVNKASTKKEVYLSLNMTQDFGNHHTCQFDTTSSTAHSLHDYHESFLKIPLASSEVYHSKQAILLRARFSNGFLKRKHRFVTQKFIKIHSFCFFDFSDIIGRFPFLLLWYHSRGYFVITALL